MTKVHIVNHTHWDREWYFTSADSLVLSDQLFSDVIDELLENTEASFVLDGQISILDDYLELYPEKMETIQYLVKNNQLYIGPWFTQTDAFFASGESVLRNAMIGVFESKKYGNNFPIAYLPDTFGFNAQIPMILSEAGFDSVIMWRGMHLEKHVSSPYFMWESMNGKNQLCAINFPQGYGTGMLLEPTTNYVEGRLDKAVDFIRQYTEGEIIIPSGNDQLGIIEDFTEKVKEINNLGKYTYKTSDYLEFIDYLKTQDLETYAGEFREPVLARVHKTIGSVRMDLKKEIFHLEDKLTYRIEPMLVIAEKLGIKLSNRLLMKAWKKLLECQAHDSLAGCVSDSVAVDIEHRLKEANEICDSMENIVTKRISEALELLDSHILILNTDIRPFKGSKIVKVLSKTPSIKFEGYNSTLLEKEFIESRKNILEETPSGNRIIEEPGYYILTVSLECELPGLGYKVFEFIEDDSMDQYVVTDNQSIECEAFKLEFVDYQLQLVRDDKKINCFISIEDEGNAGDTYDFSPIENSVVYTLNFDTCTCYSSHHINRMVLKGLTKLPYSLEDRMKQYNNKSFSYEMILDLTNDGEISGSIKLINSVLNHRLRVKISLGNKIDHCIQALPFGFAKKVNKEMDGWETIYSEMPVNVEPFEKTVSCQTDGLSVSVYTQDSKEYEYVDESLYITMLATTDSLGKPDLLYRPGRASGDTTKKGHIMMDTPKAQLLDKEITFNFKMKVYNTMLDETEIANWRNQKMQTSLYYQKQSLNYFVYRIDNKIQKSRKQLDIIDNEYSLATMKQLSNVWMSSIHNSYYSNNSFVVRFENPTGEPQEIDIDSIFPNCMVQEINALEEKRDKSTIVDSYGVKSYLISENKTE